MKKSSRLLTFVLLMTFINLIFAICKSISSAGNVKAEKATAELYTAGMSMDADIIKEQEPDEIVIEIPRVSFSSQKVSGLEAKDAKAFGDAMQEAGWTPEITCLGNYCDIGTRGHFETDATIVFLSGHGYVGASNGFFYYSNLAPALHKYVQRSEGGTEYYSFKNGRVWSETEEYSNVVSHQQKQITDWLVISACNQLRADTRVSVFEAMNEPSERPLKGVLGYGSYQGSNRDELILKKFVTLCQNGIGKERVAHAWFAAHEAYGPSLSPRVRVALRDGFQEDTLAGQGAGCEDADNRIRLWWMTRGELMVQPDTDIPEEVVVEFEVNDTADNMLALTNIGVAAPDDMSESQVQAVAAVEQDERIPTDFRLYRTNTIIESDMDGENEMPVATLHTFSRYVNGIRVSEDPVQGEYLSLLMDGTKSAEIDLISRCQREISIDGAVWAAREELISKEDIISIGLECSRQLQAENYGYAPAVTKLKSIEPVYVVSPANPQKMVLAWNILDDQVVYIIMDARSGDVLYWSD